MITFGVKDDDKPVESEVSFFEGSRKVLVKYVVSDVDRSFTAFFDPQQINMIDDNTVALLIKDEFESFGLRFTESALNQLKAYLLRNKYTIRSFVATSVEPKQFYSLKREPQNIIATFPRQYLAFKEYDDNVQEASREGRKLKVFSFESVLNGRRKFIVADIDHFVMAYSRTVIQKRHFYEIIRVGFPCRLYFDMEFSIELNKHIANGQDLVDQWISLVTWKLYEYFGVHIGVDRCKLLLLLWT